MPSAGPSRSGVKDVMVTFVGFYTRVNGDRLGLT